MFDFLKKEKQRPRALAFVDFENWYITLDNAYKMRPDVRGWHDALYEHYDVVDVSFFADLSTIDTPLNTSCQLYVSVSVMIDSISR